MTLGDVLVDATRHDLEAILWEVEAELGAVEMK
jgi:hypothetical protein